VFDADIRRYLRDELLQTYLRDDARATVLRADGRYDPTPGSDRRPHEAQQALMMQRSVHV
jgi:hypothetical protein